MYRFAVSTAFGIRDLRERKWVFDGYCAQSVMFFAHYPKYKDLIYRYCTEVETEEQMLVRSQKFVTLLSEYNYPPYLRECADAPVLLYSNFQLAPDSQRYITVIGSRKYTIDGDKYCQDIIAKIARYFPSAMIVTAAVDGIADCVRKYASYFNLRTISVLPSGYNSYLSTQKNFDYTLTSHLFNQPSEKTDHIVANGILAGMSDTVIVVEAGEKSGCIDVANLALEKSHVYTVFNPSLGPSFDGNLKLINSNVASDYNNLFQ